MAALSRSESREKYSWLWATHFSAKNSKWLQDNLKDMDGKVKAMIKLIEEDADSFARRAEMYYKKRPELMKFVEEFYRAYRALAERYDHATGALRQAHRTISEVFPNQIPPSLSDESPSPSGSFHEVEPHTPEIPTPVRALFDPEELQKDALSPSPIKRSNNSSSGFSSEGFKQFGEIFTGSGGIRKVLNFESQEIMRLKDQLASETERADRAEGEIERLRLVEAEFSKARDELKRLSDDVMRGVEKLREAEELSYAQRGELEIMEKKVKSQEEEIERERDEAKRLVMEIDKINHSLKERNVSYEQNVKELESKVHLLGLTKERLETEIQNLKDELMSGAGKLKEAEQVKCSLLLQVETKEQELEKRREVTEKLLAGLKQECRKLEKEKNTSFIQYQSSVERISDLESELELLGVKVKEKDQEIEKSTARLNKMEQCKADLDRLVCTLNEEIGKLKERDLSCQETINNLSNDLNLLNKTKEKLENEKGVILEKNLVLENSLSDVSAELEALREKVVVLEASEKDLNNQISMQMDEKAGLELQLRTLHETIAGISKKISVLERSLSDLKGETEDLRAKLKDSEESKKGLLAEKDDLLSQVEEKYNQVKELNELMSCKNREYESTLRSHEMHVTSLQEQVSVHVSGMETLGRTIDETRERNSILERSLSDSNAELANLRLRLEESEESCHSLLDQKSALTAEKDDLLSQVASVSVVMKELEEKHGDLEGKHSAVCKERDLMHNTHMSALQSHEMHVTSLEKQIALHVSEIETLDRTIDEIRGKNSVLESQLADANLELERLRLELNESEDSKSVLISQKDDFVLQIETLKESMKSLSKEKEIMQNLLITKNQQHESTLQSHELHVTSLQDEMETLRHTVDEIRERNSILESGLSGANAELERLRSELKESEESCRSLLDHKSVLITEKDNLFSQVESITTIMRKLEDDHTDLQEKHSALFKERELMQDQVKELNELLSSKNREHEMHVTSLQDQILAHVFTIDGINEKNSMLERDLCDANTELERLRSELKESEESCRSLLDHKSVLITEKDSLFSQVESISAIMKKLEDKHRDLEEDHSTLTKERDLMQDQVKELTELLSCKNREHESTLQSHEKQVTSLQDQVSSHVSTIVEISEKNSTLESSISEANAELESLRSDLNESEEMYQSLLEHKSVLITEKDDLVSQVKNLENKHENALLSHKSYATSLNNQISMHVSEIETLGCTIHGLSEKISSLESSLSHVTAERDNLFSQVESIKSLMKKLETEHAELEENHSSLSKEREFACNQVKELHDLLSLKNHELGTILRSHAMHVTSLEKSIEEEQIKNLNDKVILDSCLSDMKEQNSALAVECQQAAKVISQLREELANQERERKGLKEQYEDLKVCMALEISVLTSILRQAGQVFCEISGFNEELKGEVEGLNVNLSNLSGEVCVLNERNRSISEEVQALKEKCSMLERENSRREFRLKSFSDEVATLELENKHLKGSLACLEDKHRGNLVISEFDLHTARSVCEELQLEIATGLVQLSEMEMEVLERDQKVHFLEKDRLGLGELIESLQNELEGVKMERKYEEERMQHEMHRLLNKVDQCEREIERLVGELFVFAVNSTVYEEKALELLVEKEGLEMSAVAQRETLMEGISSRDTCMNELNSKFVEMEGENGRLTAGLDSYLPLVASFREHIDSLELRVLSLSRLHAVKQDDTLVAKPDEDKQSQALPSGALELQNLISRVEALEITVVDTANQLKQRPLCDPSPKLDPSKRKLYNNDSAATQEDDQPESSKTKNNGSQIRMKDIELDQISSCSPYGIAGSEITELDDQMLQLWETAERDCSGKTRKSLSVPGEHDIHSVDEVHSVFSSCELQGEKELGIDKPETSKSGQISQKEWTRKVLEKLSSDSQRLSVLKTGIEGLKKKIEGSPKGKVQNSTEYNNIKAQLVETEEAVTEQIDLNGKATENAECYSENLEGVAEDQRRVSRRKIAEAAKRGSEKIGRLELECQKIEYVLQKLEEESEYRRSRAQEKRARVLLRDYIYGRRRKMKLKRPICWCIRPKTKGE